jgi:hypothetical protein
MNEEIRYYTDIHPEDKPVRGNLIASGDDVFDKECEDEVLERLTQGDILAWCIIEVRAEWKGLTGRVLGEEYLLTTGTGLNP